MFDAHAHVSFFQFDEDREDVIKRAFAAGLSGWLEVGTDLEQSKKAIELAGSHDGVYASVGVHPSDIGSGVDWNGLRELLAQPEVVAVGEVGFDFFRGGRVEDQEEPLRRFIDMAMEFDLPMIFHVRSVRGADAHDELLRVLGSYEEKERPRGVIHTYSGSPAQAKQYVDLGIYLSFSGVITFKNAAETARVAEETPLERILIETDCPFLAPEPHRGKRNEPAYVVLVAEKLAELRGADIAEIRAVTAQNTKFLFKIP